MSTGGSDEFRASFFVECEELLEAMTDGLGLMQSDEDDEETIHVIFRAVHSIKGGAGAFGLDVLVAFAHHFETALDLFRSGKITLTSDLLDLFMLCGDRLADLVASSRDETEIDQEKSKSLRDQLDAVIGVQPAQQEAEAPSFEPMSLDLGGMLDLPEIAAPPTVPCKTLSFAAEPELFSSGNEPALLFKALDRLGSTIVEADFSKVPPLSSLDPAMSFMTWKISLETEKADDAILDVFDFVSDCADILLTAADAQDAPTIPAEDVSESTPVEPPLPEISPESSVINPPPTVAVDDEPSDPEGSQTPDDENRAKAPMAAKKATPQTIRVEFERVDKLINLVGELVIKEAMLSQSVAALNLPTGSDALLELESLKQLAGEIQEGVMAIRAQPIKPLFQRMARTIRDASTMTGKRVKLILKGESAEVDKTVLERLVDPLTHMVRNAVDHGLEDAATRRAAGKPEEGTVVLAAAHRSGRVVIEISDDGGGINRKRVREIAEQKGLISPDANLTPSEIDALLFMPGFSSKEEVSELSGRGVGLDVARSEITALGGRLTIQSEPGKGSVFSISLPLTLAVLEGMVVEVAGQTMVVPITAIQETLQPVEADIHSIGSDARVLSIREGLVPVADLGTIFGFREPVRDIDEHVLLVLETETERRCALVVDRLQDQRQVVIKSIETNYEPIKGVAAATILGDGRIALIVDPDGVASTIAPISQALSQSVQLDQTAGGDLVTT